MHVSCKNLDFLKTWRVFWKNRRLRGVVGNMTRLGGVLGNMTRLGGVVGNMTRLVGVFSNMTRLRGFYEGAPEGLDRLLGS